MSRGSPSSVDRGGDGSQIVIFAAGAANLAIAAIKAGAGAFTGSAAMLTEAAHSFVDTADEALLLLGRHRARRPADERHPFGHGMELYFWGFVVALLVFTLGGAFSIGEGIWKLFHPEPIRRPWVSFLVLGAALVFEAISLGVGWRRFDRVRPRRRGWLSGIRSSKDPSLFATLIEDSAAIVGLGIAAAGVALATVLGDAWPDALASILIGLLLIGVAAFMAAEMRSLLTGEAAAREVRQRIIDTVNANADVRRLDEALTLQLGPDDILVALTLEFAAPEGETARAAARVIAATARCDRRIRRVFLRPGAEELRRLTGVG